MLFLLSYRGQLLKPNEKTQNEMVAGGLAEILCRVAEGDEIVFCLPGPDNSFEASASYGIDGVTEKVSEITDKFEIKFFKNNHGSHP